ncbi:MAG: hypothetical protein WAW61_22545 [Methylococcaceae bacterium]
MPETDYTEWSAATAYVVGNKVIKAATHRIYECLVNNTNFDPETNLTGVAPKWMDYAPTNRWAMFDDVVGTKTANAGSIVVTLLPGAINGLALLGCIGADVTIILKDTVAGVVVYSKTVSLDDSPILSLYDWFFQPYLQKEDVVLTDIPYQYPVGELTITVTAATGNASVGVCKFGGITEIGGTQYGATSGITDYSVKEADVFGNYTILKRTFAKRATFNIQTDAAAYNKIFRQLALFRATPCIWIGTEVAGYEPLTIYGFYKDFSIEISYPTTNMCSIEIEGLT